LNETRSPSSVFYGVDAAASCLHDLLTGQDITPAPAVGRGFGGFGLGFGGRGPAGPSPRTSFTFTVLPHSYMAFAAK